MAQRGAQLNVHVHLRMSDRGEGRGCRLGRSTRVGGVRNPPIASRFHPPSPSLGMLIPYPWRSGVVARPRIKTLLCPRSRAWNHLDVTNAPPAETNPELRANLPLGDADFSRQSLQCGSEHVRDIRVVPRSGGTAGDGLDGESGGIAGLFAVVGSGDWACIPTGNRPLFCFSLTALSLESRVRIRRSFGMSRSLLRP